jgi:hypothetical protein
MTTFSALPAQINSTVAGLVDHKYWGNDFAQGKMEFLVVQKDNGSFILLATYGTWGAQLENMNNWDTINLQHTQSGAHTYTGSNKTSDVITARNLAEMTEKYGTKKMPTWTLK